MSRRARPVHHAQHGATDQKELGDHAGLAKVLVEGGERGSDVVGVEQHDETLTTGVAVAGQPAPGYAPPMLLVLLACAQTQTETPTVTTSPAPAAAPAAVEEPALAVRNIDVATLKADKERLDVKLVDVRTPEEFASGHVPGAVNIPLDQLGARIGEVDAPGAEVYLVCRSGGRSAKAADLLLAQGYATVNVQGGTEAWKAAGYPVE